MNQRLFRLLRLGHVVGHGRQQLPAARAGKGGHIGQRAGIGRARIAHDCQWDVGGTEWGDTLDGREQGNP
ncbi:MAG: hypothetical protein ACRDTH_08820 [Pseudonocardiaceae bacterium]